MLARLETSSLPYEDLLHALAHACEQCPQCMSNVNALLLQHSPLPEWAISSVLMSVDLIPHLFASLDMKHSSAACVCKVWMQAWKDTDSGRRGLRIGHLIKASGRRAPDVLAAHPNGDCLAIAASGSRHLRVVDLNMKLIAVIHMDTYASNALFATDFIFVATSSRPIRIIRYTSLPPFRKIDEYEAPEESIGVGDMVMAKEVLYVVLYGREGTSDEIFAIDTPDDTHSLNLRFRFGAVHPAHDRCLGCGVIHGMTIVDENLYVCQHPWLYVLTGKGEWVRQINGDWGIPICIVHFNDRIYLTDVENDTKRIFVLTKEGNTLQVWHAPDRVRFMRICRKELIVCTEKGLSSLKGI